MVLFSSADKYSRSEDLQRTLASSSSSSTATAGHRGRAPPSSPRRTGGRRNAVPRRESTTVSIPSLSDPPIIVLHEAPVLVFQRPSSVGHATPEEMQWGNDRRTSRQHCHQTRRTSRRRRDSVQLLQQGDYPEMLLSPGTLETIVIHNGAYFVQGGHPTLQRSQSPLPIAVTYDDDDEGDSAGDPRPPPPPQKTTSATNRTGLTTGHQ